MYLCLDYDYTTVRYPFAKLSLTMAGLVELLINSGRQVDAVRFIHTFQLTERFPPVPLLKMYLKDLRRNSQGKGGNSRGAAGSQVMYAYTK